MKIRRLSIRNYRQYRKLDLDLSDSRSDVTIVVGSNGTGKTNLLNAIIWCLYGREDYYGREMDSSPFVSQKTLDEAADGEALTVSVTLQIAFTSGIEAEIARTQQFVKQGRNTKQSTKNLTVQVFQDAGKGHEKVANPDHWIDRWVPRRLEPYFLFDGERLDDFFRHAEAKKVEDAVLQIAQIDLLSRLVEHLEKVANGLYSKAGQQGDGAELKMLATRNQTAQNELDEAEAGLKLRKGQVEACSDAVRMLEGKIGNVKEIMADIRRRKDIEASLLETGDQLDECWTELKAWTTANAPAILAHAPLAGLKSAIDDGRREHRLPPPVDPQFLRDLLAPEKESCVCGASLDASTSEGADHRAAIEKLLAEYERVSEVGGVLLSLDDGVRDALARVRHAAPAVDSIMKRIADWRHRKEADAKELEVLGSRLAGHEDSHVQQTEIELSRAKRELETAIKDLAREEWKVDERRKEIGEIEAQVDRLASKVDKSRELLLQARFAKECLSVAKDLYGSLTEEVRAKMADSLQAHFKKMMWKQEAIADVTIDSSYRVSVRNNLGYEILGDLAAGERECLALAFSLALSEVSGYELPMIIDTPMGRLNPDVQCFVAGVLSESTKAAPSEQNHQLMMLMTETEYNADVANVLAARSPHVLRLEFDQADSTARLVEVS